MLYMEVSFVWGLLFLFVIINKLFLFIGGLLELSYLFYIYFVKFCIIFSYYRDVDQLRISYDLNVYVF